MRALTARGAAMRKSAGMAGSEWASCRMVVWSMPPSMAPWRMAYRLKADASAVTQEEKSKAAGRVRGVRRYRWQMGSIR